MATGIAMAASVAAICGVIVALVWVPDLRPSDEVLACDRSGGYWSPLDGGCRLTDSPLAGLAS